MTSTGASASGETSAGSERSADSSHPSLRHPSIRAGWSIFATRPIAFVVTLIVWVVLVVVSFGILALPVIAAFYHAARHSERECFFIDLERVGGMLADLGRGLRRYFFQSYVIGILGLAAAIALLAVPVLLVDHPSAGMALLIELLFLSAFFWSGATLIHAYPCLIETGSAGKALGHAWREGRRRPPYPILAASALGIAGDSEAQTVLGLAEQEGLGAQAVARSVVLLLLFAVLYTAVLLGGGTIIARTWGEAAVVPWIAAGIVALLIILRRFAPWG